MKKLLAVVVLALSLVPLADNSAQTSTVDISQPQHARASSRRDANTDSAKPVGRAAVAAEPSELVVYTEPKFCIPCRLFEADGVVEAMRKSGWKVTIKGQEGGPIPRFTLKANGGIDNHAGYVGKKQFYDWVRGFVAKHKQ